MREFTTSQLLGRPLDEVFAFHAEPANLERITPPFLRFRIVTPPPIEMREGAEIEYRLRIHGVPVRWVTRITAFEPPYRFVDEQLKGPYRAWIHEHCFERDGDATRVRDRVRYEVPGGPLEGLVHRLFVRPDIERIFRHRAETLDREFATSPPPA